MSMKRPRARLPSLPLHRQKKIHNQFLGFFDKDTRHTHQGTPSSRAHILPSLPKQLRVSRRISNRRRDLGSVFPYEVGFPSLNGFGGLAIHASFGGGVVISKNFNEKKGEHEKLRNEKKETNLGAYVLANRAASGARCVLTRRSTHADASPSWSVIANPRLFCPFSTRKVGEG